MEQKITEILVTQGKQEEKIAALFVRIDRQDELIDTVNNLAISIERLASGQETIKRDVRALRGDVDELRQKPSKRWETVVTAVVTGVVAYAIGRLTKGM